MFAMKRFLIHSFFVCRLKLNAEPNRLQRDTLLHTFFMMSQNRFKKSKKPTFLSGFQIFQLIATESILKISTFTVNLSNADSVLVNTVDFYQFYSKLINSFASIFHSLNPNESWKFPLRRKLNGKKGIIIVYGCMYVALISIDTATNYLSLQWNGLFEDSTHLINFPMQSDFQ